MTRWERWAAIAHDVSLGWMTGGIAGVGVSAALLFRLAPSREVAGQVGNAIFGVLGRSVLVLSIVLLVARLLLRRGARRREGASVSLWPCLAACALAAALALWLTPAMGAIWRAAPHDPGGAGLLGEDKARFMRLHGIANLIYLALFALGSVLIGARAWLVGRTRRRIERAPDRG